VAVIDDFSRVTLATGTRVRERRLARDKGHELEIARFLEAVRAGGPPPIAYSSLLNVSWASISVVESLKCGNPVEVPVCVA
jgi:hypothetical protein